MVTRIANQFDYADLTKKRAEVDDFAEPLFLQGGACAINYQDLLRDVQAQLGGR